MLKKIIAFYLPQFHAIPENDRAWGEGFTEWTNVKRGIPYVKSQYQPHVPLNNNYYNLLDEGVMQKQAEMAKSYGIDAFCYYHYYFANGKLALEKPLERMLKDKTIDIEFCLSWANETWTKRWDAGNQEVIIKQDYGTQKEWKQHFEYLLQFFRDERYLKEENRPIFIIYKPGEIPHLEKMLNYWNDLAKASGFSGIKYLVQFPETDNLNDTVTPLIEGIIEFEPIYTVNEQFSSSKRKFKFTFKHPIVSLKMILTKINDKRKNISRHIYSYDMITDISTKREIFPRLYPGVFPSWDNTARKGLNATIYTHSSPEKFYKYLTKKIELNNKYYKKEYLFINAWNEWAEGAHLEPDEKYQLGFLEAVKKARGL